MPVCVCVSKLGHEFDPAGNHFHKGSLVLAPERAWLPGPHFRPWPATLTSGRSTPPELRLELASHVTENVCW